MPRDRGVDVLFPACDVLCWKELCGVMFPCWPIKQHRQEVHLALFPCHAHPCHSNWPFVATVAHDCFVTAFHRAWNGCGAAPWGMEFSPTLCTNNVVMIRGSCQNKLKMWIVTNVLIAHSTKDWNQLVILLLSLFLQHTTSLKQQRWQQNKMTKNTQQHCLMLIVVCLHFKWKRLPPWSLLRESRQDITWVSMSWLHIMAWIFMLHLSAVAQSNQKTTMWRWVQASKMISLLQLFVLGLLAASWWSACCKHSKQRRKTHCRPQHVLFLLLLKWVFVCATCRPLLLFCFHANGEDASNAIMLPACVFAEHGCRAWCLPSCGHCVDCIVEQSKLHNVLSAWCSKLRNKHVNCDQNNFD